VSREAALSSSRLHSRARIARSSYPAARNKVPAVYSTSVFARDGGLLSYGVDQVDILRRAASYVDRILGGEKPGELRRREFIALLGAAVACPLATHAQQADRVRRIGVLMPFDENDPAAKPSVSAFIQALAGLGWTDSRNVRMDLRWAAVTSIGYERSRRSWSACNPTSS
jgi:hypothetical protein